MNAYLLDTNHAGHAMLSSSPFRRRLQSSAGGLFHLPMPVVGELWYMVLNSARVVENERELQRLLQLFQIVPFDHVAAREYGQVRTDLRRAGKPIPQIDAQIAAIALIHEMTVLSADQHFRHVPGIKQENWLVTAP